MWLSTSGGIKVFNLVSGLELLTQWGCS